MRISMTPASRRRVARRQRGPWIGARLFRNISAQACQENRSASFTIGDALVMRVDVANHNMKVLRNGKLLRTIPISAGKPGFTTRSGTKVIVEKFRYKRMNAATTGISEDDPEYYDLSNVEYAQRVTYSGEFIHAAP